MLFVRLGSPGFITSFDQPVMLRSCVRGQWVEAVHSAGPGCGPDRRGGKGWGAGLPESLLSATLALHLAPQLCHRC